jgi:hypothetical protein
MKKVKENIEMELNDVDVVQPSESALYIQDTCQKVNYASESALYIQDTCQKVNYEKKV